MKPASVLVAVLLAGCVPAAAPAASRSPATAATASSQPAAGDLIHFPDGNVPGRHIAVDWSGKQVSSLTVNGWMQPSQNGRQILIEGSTVVDPAGNVIGTLQLGDPDVRDRIWADDGRHLCLIAGPTNSGPDMGRGALWLALPGRLARKVAAVGRLGSNPGIIACSIAMDRAVVTSNQSWHAPQGNKNVITVLVQVIELSTGRVLYQRDYSQVSPFPPLLVMASPDGQYLAENGLDWTAVIRDVTRAKSSRV